MGNDNTTGKKGYYTHVLLLRRAGEEKYELLHFAIDLNQNVVVAPQVIANDVDRAAMDGSDDNKRLYVVFNVQKSFEEPMEVYFMESINNGNTWTQPQLLGEPNDGNQRCYANIVVQKETGRIWVFYMETLQNGDSPKLVMVTRPSGSILFSKEKFIYYFAGKMQLLEAAYTRDAKQATRLHLQWSNMTGLTDAEIFYISSIDNGESWTSPHLLFSHQASMLYTLSGSHSPQVPTLASTSNAKHSSYLRVSENAGQSWSDIIEYPATGMRAATICGNDTPYGTYIFVLTKSGKQMRFYYMRAKGENQMHEGDIPFNTTAIYQTTFGISCAVPKANLAVVNAFAISSEGQYYNLLAAYNNFTI